MIKPYYILILAASLCITCKKSGTQSKNKGELAWLDIQTAGTAPNTDGKMYFIDVYTDWCGWCKTMDKKTFTDPEVIKKLNERFHAVKFNAEQRTAIEFNGKNYEWQVMGRNGVNALAIQLLEGNLSYPSFVVLDKFRNPVGVIRGFKEPADFLNILQSIQ